jgi:hypothetical protein
MTRELINQIYIALIFNRIFFASAQALPGGYLGDLREVPAHIPPIQKTMQVDDADRRTEEQYALENNMTLEEVQAKFGASGAIVCRNSAGSGQVTIRNDIATTSAHLFFNPKNCKLLNEASDCRLELSRGNKKQLIPIEAVVSMGFKCPSATRDTDDWAVVKLKVPAIGVKPYNLPFFFNPVSQDQVLISVAVGALDFTPQGPQYTQYW